MYPGLKSYIQKIKDGASDISEERKSKLTQLTEYIRDKKDSSDSAKVNLSVPIIVGGAISVRLGQRLWPIILN